MCQTRYDCTSSLFECGNIKQGGGGPVFKSKEAYGEKSDTLLKLSLTLLSQPGTDMRNESSWVKCFRNLHIHTLSAF